MVFEAVLPGTGRVAEHSGLYRVHFVWNPARIASVAGIVEGKVPPL